MGATIDDYCEDCFYLNKYYFSMKHCDYIGVTGQRRGCPPGEGCKRKLTSKRRHQQMEEEQRET